MPYIFQQHGISGYSGFSGLAGSTGSSGVSGFSGYSGPSGYSGYSGPSGYSGYSGPSGYSGYSGLSGFSGYSGTSGFSGYSGDSGISGFSGYSGRSGFSGYSGATGGKGAAGDSGFSGYSGTSGYSGYSGTSGYSGYSGPTSDKMLLTFDLPTSTAVTTTPVYIKHANTQLTATKGLVIITACTVEGMSMNVDITYTGGVNVSVKAAVYKNGAEIAQVTSPNNATGTDLAYSNTTAGSSSFAVGDILSVVMYCGGAKSPTVLVANMLVMVEIKY